MKNMKTWFFGFILFIAFSAKAEEKDTAYVNQLLQQSKAYMGSNPDSATLLAEQAKDVAHQLGFTVGEAYAYKNLGMVHFLRAEYKEALEQWNVSLELFESVNEEVGIANMLNNIGAIYKEQGVDDKALELVLRSLTISEKLNDKLRIMSALTTIASIYHNKKDRRALDYLFRSKQIADKDGLPTIDANIGEIYYDLAVDLQSNKDSAAVVAAYYKTALGFYDASLKTDRESASAAFALNGKGKIYFRSGKYAEAIQYHQQALLIAEKLDDKLKIFPALQGIANAYVRMNNFSNALEYYSRAQKLAEEVDNNDLAVLYHDMADAYESNGDFRQSLAYQKKYEEVRQKIFDQEQKRRMGRIDLENEIDKKLAQVALLTKQRQIERQAKLGFAGGLISILVIFVILFLGYKSKVRTNKILDKQKDEIEGLLLNILPADVANELKVKGNATPKHYENASVLFTDFKGFTAIADKMSPSEVVSQLNTCFIAFDNIVEKYGLEKIKTIGDSYMCAGGVPRADAEHPYKIVKAGMEMQEWVAESNKKRIADGLDVWEVRIGVHTGPLVAGIVGKKKYAYDIWGSTVNIASRMESNGEPGRVNISAAAYELVKDKFQCSHRGKHYAKNVGEIDMYFVETELEVPHEVYPADVRATEPHRQPELS
jgi:adenylate cyclase